MRQIQALMTTMSSYSSYQSTLKILMMTVSHLIIALPLSNGNRIDLNAQISIYKYITCLRLSGNSGNIELVALSQEYEFQKQLSFLVLILTQCLEVYIGQALSFLDLIGVF